jgi:hypothetical protein
MDKEAIMKLFDGRREGPGRGLSRRQLFYRVGGGVAGAMLASLGLPGVQDVAEAAGPTSLRDLLRRIGPGGCNPGGGIRGMLPNDHPVISIRDLDRRYAGRAPDSCVPPAPITSRSFHSDVTTPGSLPIGGSLDVTVNSKGDFTFSGHMHDSGFVNLHYALVAAIVTPSGIAYSLAHQGAVDGTSTFFGRKRDDDWINTGANPQLAGNWDQVSKATLFWQLQAGDTLSKSIEDMLEQLLTDALKQLGQAAVTALVALVAA